MLRENRRLFLWTTLAALTLRLFFFVYFPSVTDDSHAYIDLATNWLQHGVYGQTQLGNVVPGDTRLPGYPAFLAAIFWLFGVGSVRAVLITQILFDLGTCIIIADLARRAVPGRRSSGVAFVLAAVCPFLANYAAAVLTETLEIFFTVVALDFAVTAIDSRVLAWRMWAGAGISVGICILLRPDGGILLAAVGLFGAVAVLPDRSLGSGRFRNFVLAEIVLVACALSPLVPWTIRNFHTLHHFQPLAPRYANESDELAPRGFNRWAKTWIVDYASVEEVYWNVPGDKIEIDKLPSRALDEPPTRDTTFALLSDYNQSQELTPALDARFGDLAAERIRARPVRYYAVLPVLRVADMWLRPRTELLPPDIRWWEFNDETWYSALAVAFGLLNLAYVATAAIEVVLRRSDIRFLGLLIGFLVLRSAFLGTIENPEPRYTLECYPVIIVLASALLAGRRDGAQPLYAHSPSE